MPELIDILLGGVLPFAISFTILAITARKRPERSAWLDALVVGVSFLAGYLGLVYLGRVNTPQLKPIAAEDWLPHIAVTAIVISLIAGITVRSWPAWLLRIPFVVAAVWLALHTFITYDWSVSQAILYVAAISIGALVLWGTNRLAETKTSGSLTTILATVTAFAVTHACLFGASAKLAQIGGALTAAVAGMVVVSLFKRRADPTNSTNSDPTPPNRPTPPKRTSYHPATVAFPVSAALLLSATAYANLPAYAAITLLAVPTIPLFFTCNNCSEWLKRKPVAATTVVILICLAIITAVLLPSALGFIEDMQQMQNTGYENYGY